MQECGQYKKNERDRQAQKMREQTARQYRHQAQLIRDAGGKKDPFTLYGAGPKPDPFTEKGAGSQSRFSNGEIYDWKEISAYVTDDFMNKLYEIGNEVGVNPEYLLVVINSESGINLVCVGNYSVM